METRFKLTGDQLDIAMLWKHWTERTSPQATKPLSLAEIFHKATAHAIQIAVATMQADLLQAGVNSQNLESKVREKHGLKYN